MSRERSLIDPSRPAMAASRVSEKAAAGRLRLAAAAVRQAGSARRRGRSGRRGPGRLHRRAVSGRRPIRPLSRPCATHGDLCNRTTAGGDGTALQGRAQPPQPGRRALRRRPGHLPGGNALKRNRSRRSPPGFRCSRPPVDGGSGRRQSALVAPGASAAVVERKTRGQPATASIIAGRRCAIDRLMLLRTINL